MHTTRRARMRLLTPWIALFAALTLVTPVSARPFTPEASRSSAQSSWPPRAWAPITPNGNPPPPSISRYMGASNIGFTPGYNLGVSRAQATLPGQDVVVILDFLYPYTSGSGFCNPDVDGTILATANCVSEDSAAVTVEGLINGFMAGGYYRAGSHLTVAMGVSNCDLSGSGPGGSNGNLSGNGTYLTQEFGTSWSNTVNGVLSYVSNYGWENSVDAWGGLDAEDEWNSGQATLNWALAFSQITASFYVDFGACEDCSATQCTAKGAGLRGSPSWTCQQRYDVAQGEPANPTYAFSMPEIYNTSGYNATQWYNLSLYGHNFFTQGGTDGAIEFRGALTQSNACQEVGCPAGTNNDPNTGFDQLYSAVLTNPSTDGKATITPSWCGPAT